MLISRGFSTSAQEGISSLPILKNEPSSPKDWLINSNTNKAGVFRSNDTTEIILSNGLLTRSFRLSPNLACVNFSNESSAEQLIRAISPEASVSINGKSYHVGGLYGQTEKAYLKKEWLKSFTSNSSDFQYKSFSLGELVPYVNWHPGNRWVLNSLLPTGKLVSFLFDSKLPELKDVIIKVNYELFDNMPLLCKWLSVESRSTRKIKIDHVKNEILATPEEETAVFARKNEMKIPHGLYIESNYSFNNSMTSRLSDQTTFWKADSTFTSQVNYNLQTPCLVEVTTPIGPAVELKQGEIFKSIRTYELLLDSYDRERNGMAQRKMYSKIIPWATENPIFMHVTSTDPTIVKNAIDQCAETGYEGIILSFGSGLDMEDLSVKNVNDIRALVDYAHHKKIILGGYSLFSSRKISDEDDVIDPKTGKPDVHAQFGAAPCLGSSWGLNYIKKLKEFILQTRIDLLENDGPYPGDLCASTKHPGHIGLDDSQWAQLELQKGLYRWCNENGVYVNAPDWYFLDGTNKISLGYRERNFSLPREQQVLLNRQNIFDGTWEKMPSMCWGFVPLTEYQGGGTAATLEPLAQHLDSYELLMMQYYGAGVQACYRGPRLYDTEETKSLVIKIISWYKKYRTILNSQIIHLRRPDGRDWDGILHVNPDGKEKGLAMLYNPLNKEITREIKIPLYYTGLDAKVKIRTKEGKSKKFKPDKKGDIYYTVHLPAKGYTWIVIEE